MALKYRAHHTTGDSANHAPLQKQQRQPFTKLVERAREAAIRNPFLKDPFKEELLLADEASLRKRLSQGTYTMEDFWMQQGWFKRKGLTVALLLGKWAEEQTRISAIRFLVEHVLKKDPIEVTIQDFKDFRMFGFLSHYYKSSPFRALLEAGLVSEADRAHMLHYPRLPRQQPH